MTAPALALVPVLTDRHGDGASTRTLDAELLERATRDDYQHWLGTAIGRRGMRPPDPAARHHPRHRPIDRRDPLAPWTPTTPRTR